MGDGVFRCAVGIHPDSLRNAALRQDYRGLGISGTEQHATLVEVEGSPELPNKRDTDYDESGSRDSLVHPEFHTIRLRRTHFQVRLGHQQY